MNADHKLLGTDRDKIARLQTPATRPASAEWTERDSRIARMMVNGGDDDGIPLGPMAALRLLDALDAMRAERDAALAALEVERQLVTILASEGSPVPAADAPDLPPFLAGRVNGGAG